MLNFLFRLLMILPIFQTWLTWNGVGIAQYLDHALYFAFSVILVLFIFLKNIKLSKQLILVISLFALFINMGLFTTLIQGMLNNHTSLNGVLWEVYKLSRNLSIFLFAYYFQNKNDVIKNVKMYFKVSFLFVLISIFQYSFGLKAYEILHFIPASIEDYPDFYNVYIPQNRTMGLLQHPGIYAEFVLVALMVLIFSVALKVRLFKYKFYHYLTLLTCLIGIFISSSRSTFLLSIILPFLLSYMFKMRKIRKIYYVLLFLASPFLYFAIKQLLFKLWQYSYYTVQLGQTEGRIVYWEQALDIFKNNPFGSGLGTWGDASAQYSNYQPSGEIVKMSDAYLSHLIAENGFSLVFITILFIYCLRFFRKGFKKTSDNFVRFLNITSFSFLLFIFFSSFKSMQLSMFEDSFFIFYILGFTFKMNLEHKRDKVEDKLNHADLGLTKHTHLKGISPYSK